MLGNFDVIVSMLFLTRVGGDVSRHEAPKFVSSAADFISVGYKSSVRMGVEIRDFTRLEISVRTNGALEDGGHSLARNGVTVEVMSGDQGWTVVDLAPSVRGGVYTWVQPHVAPCLEHRIRVWVLDTQGGQASFEYPHPVLAVSVEDMLQSGYRPDAPADLQVDTDSGGPGQVTASWSRVHCAQLYDVTYTSVTSLTSWSVQVTSPSVQLVEGIDSCGEYDIVVSAVIDTHYSDDVTGTFITPPLRDIALLLDPIVLPGARSITAKWRGFEKLSCIRQYQVMVCKEGNECPETINLERDDSVLLTEFTSSVPLDLCTDYSLHIKPIWTRSKMNLYEKVVNFRTLSPPLANISRELKMSSAKMTDVQSVVVRWAGVQCAGQYKVWAMYGDMEDWEMVGVTSKNYYHHTTLACTEYKFGLSLTLGDEESDIVGLDSSIMTNIDTNIIYSVPNIETIMTPGGAEISWDHRKCIHSYRIKCCTKDATVCYEASEVTEKRNMTRVSHSITNLSHCTDYSLSIYPSTAEAELDSQPLTMTTLPPPPRPPASVDVRLNDVGDKVDISWSQVECATGYRIHQKLDHSETETVWIAQHGIHLYLSLDSPEPCVTYSYGVSSLIGTDESHPSHWHHIPVPPRTDNSEHVEILNNNNNSVDFTINKGIKNQNCKVEKYQIRHDGEEYFVDPEGIHNGKFHIKLKTQNSKFEARLKYFGYKNWTRWMAPESGRSSAALYLSKNIVTLLPVIVTSAVILVLLLGLTICIVKRKQSQLKYDAEIAKVDEHCQDIQKHLNDKYFR